MELFSKYLDQINAETELKERTKVFVKSELERKTRYKTVDYGTRSFEKRSFTTRWLRTAVYTIAALSVVTLSGYAYYNHPVSYVSLDINPSVELSMNALDVVIDSEGINGDGESLVKNNSVTHIAIEDAIGILVGAAGTQQFIAKDGSTVIAVTVISNKEEDSVLLMEKCEEAVRQAMITEEIDAIVYISNTDFERRTLARSLGISAGKYKMIEMLQQLDSSITFEKYRYMNITDIVEKANELLLAADAANRQTTQMIDQDSITPVMEQNMEQDKTQIQKQNSNDQQLGVATEPGTATGFEGLKEHGLVPEPGVVTEPGMVTEPGVMKNPGVNDAGTGGTGGEDAGDKNNLDNRNPQDDSNMNSDGKL